MSVDSAVPLGRRGWPSLGGRHVTDGRVIAVSWHVTTTQIAEVSDQTSGNMLASTISVIACPRFINNSGHHNVDHTRVMLVVCFCFYFQVLYTSLLSYLGKLT